MCRRELFFKQNQVRARRKGARIDWRLFAVQFDKIDHHQPVRLLTAFFSLGKNGALVGQRHPCPQLGLPIPQRNSAGLGLDKVVFQPLLVA
jgi:hypothetical protein